MAETQQVETHSDSAGFNTAESKLKTMHGIRGRCINWGNFHHGIEHIGPKHSAEKLCECTILPRAHRAEAFRRKAVRMHHPPHGRDESLFRFCTTQCGVAIPRYNGAVCKLGKLSSRHRAHRAEAFRRKVLQMQLPPHGRDESLFHFRITQSEAFCRKVLQMQRSPHGRDES